MFHHSIRQIVCLVSPLLIGWSTSGVRAAVVHNQLGDPALYEFELLPPPTLSQIFTDFPDFSCTVLEDFEVDSSQLRITQVSVLFRAQAGFVGFASVSGYLLNFYSDVNLAAASLAGNAGSIEIPTGGAVTVTQVVDPGGNHEYGLVELDVDVVLPAAGTYWVGVSPVAASSVAGQFYVQTTTQGIAQGASANAKLANPGLGHGVGALSTPGNHYAYAVVAVPEPGVLPFWLAGMGWWVVRRRRGGALPTRC